MLVSLAYSGLRPEELRETLAGLQAADLKATFFVNPPVVLEHLELWMQVALGGHEIANAALSGVTLSGELINWTCRMVEQDLHMTQSFLDDMFEENAVPVFLYPGPFTRCADGDYRSVIEAAFPIAVSPGSFEFAPSERSIRRTFLQDWSAREAWTVLHGLLPGPEGLDALQVLLEERPQTEVLGVYAAAKRLGRAEPAA